MGFLKFSCGVIEGEPMLYLVINVFTLSPRGDGNLEFRVYESCRDKPLTMELCMGKMAVSESL